MQLRWPSGRSAKVELEDFNLKHARGPDDRREISKECGYQVEPDPVAMRRAMANTSVSRLAQAACVFALRRTGGGYGPHRDEAERG